MHDRHSHLIGAKYCADTPDCNSLTRIWGIGVPRKRGDGKYPLGYQFDYFLLELLFFGIKNFFIRSGRFFLFLLCC